MLMPYRVFEIEGRVLCVYIYIIFRIIINMCMFLQFCEILFRNILNNYIIIL